MEDKQIQKRAEVFLSEIGVSSFPVDVEEICDKLDINLMYIPGIKKSFSVDAFITSDFKMIIADEESAKKYVRRHRFSVAHELAHMYLHKDCYPQNLKGIDDYIKYENSVNGTEEYQANMFAGFVLVPAAELGRQMTIEFGDDIEEGVRRSNPGELADSFASLSSYFDVSGEVIQRRVIHEYKKFKSWIGI